MSIRRLALVLLLVMVISACSGGGPEDQTYTIGVLTYIPAFDLIFEGFSAGMADLGYVEGENMTYLYDSPAESLEALDPVIEDLKRRDIDLLLTFGTPASMRGYAAFADTDVPILFVPVNDPVAAGLVESLLVPGGSSTGLTFPPTEIRMLEWLLELLPDTQTILVPHNPTDVSSIDMLTSLSAAESDLGVEFLIREVSTPEEAIALAQNLPDGVDAVFIGPIGILNDAIVAFVESANERSIPVIGGTVNLVELGVFMNYTASFDSLGRQASPLADQMLKGTAPANLPVQEVEASLTINLQAAEIIGLEVPDTFLERVDNIYRGSE